MELKLVKDEEIQYTKVNRTKLFSTSEMENSYSYFLDNLQNQLTIVDN